MFVSLFPNWLGQTQSRVVKIEGDMLHLSSATPIMSGGKQTMSYLSWRRAEPWHRRVRIQQRRTHGAREQEAYMEQPSVDWPGG
jgi:hypothetical protein